MKVLSAMQIIRQAVAVMTANSAAINTTETVLASGNILTPVVGTTYRITLAGTSTSTAANASTFTIRVGTAGTTADASVATGAFNAATTGTNVTFRVVLEYTVRSTGTTGNGAGVLQLVNGSTSGGIAAIVAGVVTLTTTATLNTTTATKLSITYKSAATTTTTTFTEALIETI